MEVVQIPLRNSDQVALIDADDLPLVEGRSWGLTSRGYVASRSNGRWTLLHRLLLKARLTEVDHANGNPLDNRRSNLRLASHAENMMNKRIYRNNRSGFKGVYRDKRGRWVAQVKVNGRKFARWGFADPEDAARAYDALAREHHGEFARLNFPNEVAA